MQKDLVTAYLVTRLGCMLGGVFLAYLGYKLYFVRRQQPGNSVGELKAQSLSLKIKGSGPGVLCFFLGVVIAVSPFALGHLKWTHTESESVQIPAQDDLNSQVENKKQTNLLMPEVYTSNK